MLTNGVCTIYSNGTFTIVPCFWQDTQGVSTQKYGAVNANKATVFIPIDCQKPKDEDHIIKGEVTAGTLKELLSMGALKIMTVDTFDFGSEELQHYEVGAK